MLLEQNLFFLFRHFCFSSIGNENLLSDYKPFSPDPGCPSDSGQATIRGRDENRTGYVDRGNPPLLPQVLT